MTQIFPEVPDTDQKVYLCACVHRVVFSQEVVKWVHKVTECGPRFIKPLGQRDWKPQH